MKSANYLRYLHKIVSVFLIAVTLLLSAPFISSARMQALAVKPLTPEAAAYEIDHADNAETAGKRIQQRSDRYKQEKDNDDLPVEKAAKTASKILKAHFNRPQILFEKS